MNGLRFGKFLGISLELHYTFILLILFVLVSLFFFDPANALGYSMLFFFLFLSVFIHELFHSIVSVLLGNKVERIILLPIGGVSISKKIPEKARDEFLIAVAGPFFNFFVVFGILIILTFFPGLPWPSEQMLSTSEGLEKAILAFPLFTLFWVNLILGAFNLFVPALPLDGGRVLRSLLAFKFGFNKATHLASKISIFLSSLMFLIALFAGHIILLIISVFVFLGAKGENDIVLIRENLKGAKISPLINRNPFTLNGNESIEEAVKKMEKNIKNSALIKNKNSFFQINLELISKIKKKDWKKIKVKDIAEPIEKISFDLTAEKAMLKFLESKSDFLIAMKGNKFFGVIEEWNLRRLYNINKLKNM